MATEYIKQLKDDMVKGEDADVTMEFGFSGTDYEIDLANKRFTKYSDVFQELIQHARVVRRRGAKKGSTSSTTSTPGRHGASGMSKEQLNAVRRWARENGYPTLSDKGRIPGDVLAAFEAAGGLTIIPEFQAPEFSAQ